MKIKIDDFDQLNKVAKYGGVYLLWDIDDFPLYAGHAKKLTFGQRISSHYLYLRPLIHSISIYPTNEHRLLEYTLIERLYPYRNVDRSWNQITHGQYGSEPYLLPEDSYWGHKFHKREHRPFEMNSVEDYEYLEGVMRLEKELKRLKEH